MQLLLICSLVTGYLPIWFIFRIVINITTNIQHLPSQGLFESCKLSPLVPRTVVVDSPQHDILELPGDEKDWLRSFCLAGVLFNALHPVFVSIVGQISF